MGRVKLYATVLVGLFAVAALARALGVVDSMDREVVQVGIFLVCLVLYIAVRISRRGKRSDAAADPPSDP